MYVWWSLELGNCVSFSNGNWMPWAILSNVLNATCTNSLKQQLPSLPSQGCQERVVRWDGIDTLYKLRGFMLHFQIIILQIYCCCCCFFFLLHFFLSVVGVVVAPLLDPIKDPVHKYTNTCTFTPIYPTWDK